MIKSLKRKHLTPWPLESLNPLLQLNWRKTPFSKMIFVIIFIMSLTLMTRKALEAKGWKVKDSVGEKLIKK